MKLRVLVVLLCLMSIGVTAASGELFTQETLGKFCVGIQSDDKTELVQVGVLKQSANQADCAYHALRNGCLIALAALDSQGNHFESLFDKNHMNERFSPSGDWRARIIKERIMLIGRKIICEKLMKSFKGARVVPRSSSREGFPFNDGEQKLIINEKYLKKWDEQELKVLINAVKNVICRFEPEINKKGLHYSFDTEEFYAELMENIPDGTCEKFDEYFSAIDEDFTISWNGELLEKGKIREHTHKGRCLDGQWVEMNEELPLLLRVEKEYGLLKDYPIATALYTGIQQPKDVFDQMTKEDYSEFKKEFINAQLLDDFKAMRDKVQKGEDFVGLILVYLGGDASISVKDELLSTADHTQSLDSRINNGHWVSMVVIARKGKRQYVVADSLHGNLLVNKTIYRVMSFLEGAKIKVPKKKKIEQSLKNTSKKEPTSGGWPLFSWKTLASLGVTASAGWYAYTTYYAQREKAKKS